MVNYRVCTERIPKADSLFWLLGWKWEWWLEDDRRGDWKQTWHDPYKKLGYGTHRARSKDEAIESGKSAISYIRSKEWKSRTNAAARAATHECVPE